MVVRDGVAAARRRRGGEVWLADVAQVGEQRGEMGVLGKERRGVSRLLWGTSGRGGTLSYTLLGGRRQAP